LTTNQLAGIYGVDHQFLRNNYRNYSESFTKGTDFFILEGPELAKYKAARLINIPQVVNRVFLWTKAGAHLHAKLLNDAKIWQAYRQLQNTYFNKHKAGMNDEFDLMRKIIDHLEEVKYSVDDVKAITDEAKQFSMEAMDMVKKLEEKVDVVVTKDCVKASDIAHYLKLYSESDLPHSGLVSAAARLLKMKIDYKHHYQDDYIIITGDESREPGHWQVYYKPEGAEMIIKWFEKNRDLIKYQEEFKKDCEGGKKGDIKEKGYIVNGVRYKVRM
jgi:hypothetical protein